MNDATKRYMKRITEWVVNTFGDRVLNDRHERALRVVEEAVELAQSEGVLGEEIETIIQRVYSRPVGTTYQEVSGVYLTLLALCHVANVDPDQSMEDELSRIENLPRDFFRKKHQAKINAGTSYSELDR